MSNNNSWKRWRNKLGLIISIIILIGLLSTLRNQVCNFVGVALAEDIKQIQTQQMAITDSMIESNKTQQAKFKTLNKRLDFRYKKILYILDCQNRKIKPDSMVLQMFEDAINDSIVDSL